MRRALACAGAALLLLIFLPLLAVVSTLASNAASPATDANAPDDIPPHLVPIYQAAAAAYDVHWLLLAAIHERETRFSTLELPGVRDGWNGCGAAGPMQFGVVGVPPYNATAPDCGALTGTGAGGTWAKYKNAHRRIAVTTERPPSCARVGESEGCVYADADAIAAAAAYLHDLGAGAELDDRAWHAARKYNGAPAYADAVLARARLWEKLTANDLAEPPPTPGARATLGADGLARAPENAPPEVRRAIAAANAISDRPYRLFHYPTHIGNPTYDCSSSTSHVLWGAGAFGTAPWVSGQLMRYGDPGPGRWITIYANAGHVFMTVAGLRFDTARYDTGPNRGESGPRWRLGPRPTSNFVVRHPRGF